MITKYTLPHELTLINSYFLFFFLQILIFELTADQYISIYRSNIKLTNSIR